MEIDFLEQGFEVEALFMKNWEEDDTDGHCTAQQDLSDAQKVADKLGIKLHTVAVTKPFSVAIFRTSFLLISPNGNRLFESWCWFKRCRK
jgi:tRNA U34 2-thiouridine synthase MnmA/TrmU